MINLPLVRGSDILTLVNVADNAILTPNDISQIAGQTEGFPTYKADGLGVTLIFHTATKEVILGAVRSNPCLKDLRTKDATEFPLQINSTTGGFLANSELSLRDAAVNNVKNKMFLNTSIIEEGFDAEEILKKLCIAIDNSEGWEDQVCVHTDKWMEGSDEKTMCFITTIKHLDCTDEDLQKIGGALNKIMDIKKNENVNPRSLSQFSFVELDPIVQNSLETYMDKEVEKANKAYDTFQNKVVVTFNDLAVATLANGGAFKSKESAKLSI